MNSTRVGVKKWLFARATREFLFWSSFLSLREGTKQSEGSHYKWNSAPVVHVIRFLFKTTKDLPSGFIIISLYLPSFFWFPTEYFPFLLVWVQNVVRQFGPYQVRALEHWEDQNLVREDREQTKRENNKDRVIRDRYEHRDVREVRALLSRPVVILGPWIPVVVFGSLPFRSSTLTVPLPLHVAVDIARPSTVEHSTVRRPRRYHLRSGIKINPSFVPVAVARDVSLL